MFFFWSLDSIIGLPGLIATPLKHFLKLSLLISSGIKSNLPADIAPEVTIISVSEFDNFFIAFLSLPGFVSFIIPPSNGKKYRLVVDLVKTTRKLFLASIKKEKLAQSKKIFTKRRRNSDIKRNSSLFSRGSTREKREREALSRRPLKKGIKKQDAQKYITSLFYALSEDAVVNSKKDLKFLVKESQTPKGLNEQGLKEMSKKGVYKSVINTLNSIHKRLNK